MNFPQAKVPQFISVILTVAMVVVMIVIDTASNGPTLKDLHEQAQYIL